MDNIWLDILKSALDNLAARTGEPVAGAKLRSAVKKLAEDRGIDFPPEGMTKWSSFLESFPNDVSIVRSPGSDLLVVPANRPDLQAVAVAAASATASPSALGRIRSDIFDALTRIPKPNEWAIYIPEADAVLWQGSDEDVPQNSVRFPVATLEEEIALRRRFSESDSSAITDGARDAILKACDSDGPLRQFSLAIRAYGLIQDWHVFRMSALSEKLRGWARTYGLPFRDEWLGLENPKITPTPDLSPAAVNKRGLVELAGLLSEEDISRISVPLDVVLRLLAPR